MNRNNRRRIVGLLVGVVALFIGLTLYLVYFQLVEARPLADDTDNSRNQFDERKLKRGTIFDRNGTVLAESVPKDDIFIRTYKYPNSYAHIIGYTHEKYGKTGLESIYTINLLGIPKDSLFAELKKAIMEKDTGNHLYLTIDNELQVFCYELLKGHKGAIIISDAKTGEILAMADRPSFDPNQLLKNWDSLLEDESSPLINRVTQGLYVPGSVMKVLTATALLESDIDKTYTDKGEATVEGYTWRNYDKKKYGNIDLEKALMYSVNTYFGEKGLAIGGAKMKEVAERFLFNKKIPFDLPVAVSKVSFEKNMGKSELASSSYGQGKTLTTPLQIHVMFQTFANQGTMMKPYLVQKWESSKGAVISTTTPESLGQVIQPDDIDTLLKAMKSTASVNGLKSNQSVSYYAKTGTAQNETNQDHAWFSGFMETEDRTYVVTVLLENEGKTAFKAAVPMAKAVFNKILNQ